MATLFRLPAPLTAGEQKISALGNFLIRAGQKLNRAAGGSANSAPDAASANSAVLSEVAPKFAVYFDAAPDAIYQIAMWVKHFDAVRKNYVYIVRRPDLIAPLQTVLSSSGSKAQILLAKTHIELEQIAQLPTLAAVLYVNNTARNSDMVRFAHLKHALLMHGDSEKSASFNPVAGMFTKIFVAGKAGADRYGKNGVDIDAKKFVIVGRPQLEGMQVVTEPTVGKKVLVAPTWGGSSTGMTLTSISLAPQIIAELIANDATVIFRPHPFSYRSESDKKIIKQVHEALASDAKSSGRQHVYGDAAEKISATEAINLADAMVSDLSGIVSDWLFSLKPYLLLNMDLDEKEFRKRYDIAWGGLQVSANNLSTLGESLWELISTDKLYENRVKVREHYIGAAGDTDREKLFISAVHDLIG